MTILTYNPNLKDIWNAFNKDSKNGIFMFDRDFMDYHSDRFIDNSLMFYDDNDKLIALLPCNIKDNILFSHQGLTFGGFITNHTIRQSKILECFGILQNYIKEHSIQKLIYKAVPYIYHKQPSQEDIYALFAYGATMYRVDCSTTINLQNPIKMSELRKRGIKKALKNNVKIESSDDMKSFIALVNQVLKKQHDTQATHSAKELENLVTKFPNNINLWIAKKDDEILAATLLFVYDNLVHTQYLVANDAGRGIGALDLLIYSLIEQYSTTKQYFDFGISNENNGLFLNEGLIAQKEGFGGRTITHQFFELIIQNLAK